MKKKREERNSWSSWHKEWKEAWLKKSEDRESEEELEKRRKETSITRRYPTLP
ncbi:MAG: hypothetical protein H7A25_05155 [Leptospiraceae bacterium]|nr:hypothetical protein [Leptospiraceae bacterium]MCP5499267.1 hypothetical protein [Leptospiraceae bacterium]